MNREQLISQIAADAKLTKKQSKAALESILTAVRKTLKKGGRVPLIGFGTFSILKRKARTGRNPQTGAKLLIKAKKVVKFKAGTQFSKLVNK
jgi:DNA-binding protein HU-beta